MNLSLNTLTLKIIQALTVSTFLFAQQDNIKPESALQFGIGLKTGTSANLIGELSGRTPSFGAQVDVRRYFMTPVVFSHREIALRLKGVFDNWGNQHLRGSVDNRSELKRLAATIGIQIFTKDRVLYKGLYFCPEVGVARWDINSTYEPLGKRQFNKFVFAFLMGVETRYVYIEFGFDGTAFSVPLPSEEAATLIKNRYNVTGSLVIAIGAKFFRLWR